MLLLLIRHADAGLPAAARWPDDNDRPLTKFGREAQRRVSERLRDAGFTVDAVLTSPALRARQTANIVSAVLQAPTPVPCDGLLMKPTLARLKKCLREHRGAHAVAVVGHSGWLEPVASLLLTGAPSMHIDFPKSAALCIRVPDIKPAAAALVAFLRPAIDSRASA